MPFKQMTEINAKERLVSVMQACDIAGVSRRTIYNWMGRDLLDYTRTAGGAIRIVESTLFRNEDMSALKNRVYR